MKIFVGGIGRYFVISKCKSLAGLQSSAQDSQGNCG